MGPKFLIDECLPKSMVSICEKQHLDAVHIRILGLSGIPDEKVISLAKKEKRILITRDMDFSNLLDYPIKSHCGLIVMRMPDDFTALEINRLLDSFLMDVELNEIRNTLTIIEPKRYRIRRKDLD